MQKISTTQIKSIIDFFWSKKNSPVPFLHGKPGVSKSAQVKELAASKKYKMHDIRLAQMSAMDIRGLPVINRENNTTQWFQPNFLPTVDSIAKMKEEGYEGLVLFFDELSSAVPAIQAAAYQILLDRASGDYVVPFDPDFPIHMVAAGNNLKDGAVVQNMSTALKNRVAHFQVEVDADGFISYGMFNGMDTRVISYIKSFPQYLHVMPQNDPSVYSFPTNRSWEFVSYMIKDEVYSSELQDIVSGIIGEAQSTAFAAHMQIADKLPDLDDVIDNGPKDKIDTSNVQLNWAFVIGLTSKVINKKEKITTKQIDNYLAALNMVKTEFMYIGLEQLCHKENKKFLPVYMKNKKFIETINAKKSIITNI